MKERKWWTLTAGLTCQRLPDGNTLRLLSAHEVLACRREALTLAQADREQALCANACLLARALEHKGTPVYPSGEAVLQHCTVSQIQRLARQWAEFDRAENPAATLEEPKIDALKKVWSTRRTSG